jgi:hypothetical protein
MTVLLLIMLALAVLGLLFASWFSLTALRFTELSIIAFCLAVLDGAALYRVASLSGFIA